MALHRGGVVDEALAWAQEVVASCDTGIVATAAEFVSGWIGPQGSDCRSGAAFGQVGLFAVQPRGRGGVFAYRQASKPSPRRGSRGGLHFERSAGAGSGQFHRAVAAVDDVSARGARRCCDGEKAGVACFVGWWLVRRTTSLKAAGVEPVVKRRGSGTFGSNDPEASGSAREGTRDGPASTHLTPLSFMEPRPGSRKQRPGSHRAFVLCRTMNPASMHQRRGAGTSAFRAGSTKFCGRAIFPPQILNPVIEMTPVE